MSFLIALGLLVAASQVNAAGLRGKVVDATGAGLPKARVVLRSEDSRQEIARQETNDLGTYSFADIPSGTFTLEIEEPGF
jgi:hypothetical protein